MSIDQTFWYFEICKHFLIFFVILCPFSWIHVGKVKQSDISVPYGQAIVKELTGRIKTIDANGKYRTYFQYNQRSTFAKPKPKRTAVFKTDIEIAASKMKQHKVSVEIKSNPCKMSKKSMDFLKKSVTKYNLLFFSIENGTVSW